MKLCSVLILTAAAGGCAVQADEPETGQLEQKMGGQCPSWMCGENSPVIDNFGFHELALDGTENLDHFKYERFTKGGLEYALHVTNGVITATRGAITLTGTGLMDGQMWVAHESTEYIIRIAALGAVNFWATAPNGTHPMLESYWLQWTVVTNGLPAAHYEDVCTNPGKDPMGINTHQSVVFEGDLIDAKSKTVTGYNSRWFNIGCAGSTLAKMQLTGHTQASAFYGYTTTKAQRQTMLKMLSADYCGTGTPFTVAGMPLQWEDDQGWMTIQLPSQTEAKWNENGAICLDEPRVAVNPTQLAKDTFDVATIKDAIKAECGRRLPPSCAMRTPPAHLVSANPILP